MSVTINLRSQGCHIGDYVPLTVSVWAGGVELTSGTMHSDGTYTSLTWNTGDTVVDFFADDPRFTILKNQTVANGNSYTITFPVSSGYKCGPGKYPLNLDLNASCQYGAGVLSWVGANNEWEGDLWLSWPGNTRCSVSGQAIVRLAMDTGGNIKAIEYLDTTDVCNQSPPLPTCCPSTNKSTTCNWCQGSWSNSDQGTLVSSNPFKLTDSGAASQLETLAGGAHWPGTYTIVDNFEHAGQFDSNWFNRQQFNK